MQVSKANDVKIYNLSAGKSVPDWLNDRQRRKLEQKNVEVRRRIQLIQDFEMPDVSTALEVTPDGRYIFATGTYKPYLKCYDLKNLSLKFERGLDAEAIKTLSLSDDWSKLVILEEERFVEFHHQRGRYFRLRIPRPGRDMDFCRESGDLYMVGSSNEIYRLNLEEGVFLQSLITEATSINCCQFSPVHQLFLAGTSEGTVEAWDHRDRRRVSILDTLPSIRDDIDGVTQVSAVRWLNPLQMAVGTSSGHILMYDIRSSRPLLVKDQNNALPIRRIELVQRENDSDLVMSMDDRAVKVWNRDTGKPFSAIEPQNALNDFVRYPGSGLVLMACESSRMEQYYIPSLGPAPKWCAYLETITEELEETDQPAVYDDYKFVTSVELDQLGLGHLVGSNVLRAYMHGYFMDIRLYNKARTLTQPFAYDKYKDRKLMEEVEKERETTVVKKKGEKSKVKVNADLAERLKTEAEATIRERRKDKRNKEMKKAEAASTILSDDRFSKLFQSEDFEVDEDSEAFTRAKSASVKRKMKKGSELREESEEEEEAEEQVDLSGLGMDAGEDEGPSHAGDESDASMSSLEEKSDGESESEGEKEKEEKRKRVEAARKRQQKRNMQRAFDDVEKERRAVNKPTKFTLHQVDTGETTTKFVDGDESDEEVSAPLASRKQMLVEEGMEEEGREEETPFGGKSVTFTLKKKSTLEKEAAAERAEKHLKQRKEERRTLGSVRNMMTPLPANLMLNFKGEQSARGGSSGRGGTGRGRGRGQTRRM